MSTNLKIGDRVRFSLRGREAMQPRNPDRIGTIVGNPQHPGARYIRVRWDGYKASSGLTYAPSFIERTDDIQQPLVQQTGDSK